MNQFLDVTHRKQHTRLPFMAHGGRSGQQRMEQPPISEAQPTLVGIAMFAGVPSEVLEPSPIPAGADWIRS